MRNKEGEDATLPWNLKLLPFSFSSIDADETSQNFDQSFQQHSAQNLKIRPFTPILSACSQKIMIQRHQVYFFTECPLTQENGHLTRFEHRIAGDYCPFLILSHLIRDIRDLY